MNALVIAEHSEAATSLAAGARTIADEVTVVVVGTERVPAGIADFAYHVAIPEGSVADDADATIAPLAASANVVLAEATRRLKSAVCKIAAAQGASVITDALAIDADGAEQMYFGGVGSIKRRATTSTAFYTVRASAFSGIQPSGANSEPDELSWVEPAHPVKLVSCVPVEKGGVDLSKCDALVAAGRGFAEEADLDLARSLCDKMSAGLGCTRPLADAAGWLPSETYIGVSGLMLSPKVYVAVGVSGQMQHMVGANRSGLIFAINKDLNAPIFKQCDYGLVGDLKTVLPRLVECL